MFTFYVEGHSLFDLFFHYQHSNAQRPGPFGNLNSARDLLCEASLQVVDNIEIEWQLVGLEKIVLRVVNTVVVLISVVHYTTLSDIAFERTDAYSGRQPL